MKLTVMIPAYNEERTIGDVIDRIPRAVKDIEAVEILVIDDGSQDHTAAVAHEKGARVVSHSGNLGVGAAFSTGIQAALEGGADIIVNMDADLQFNPLDIPALVDPIRDGRAGFATATRFAKKEYLPEMPWSKRFGNRVVVAIINFITKQKFTDVSCGFRAFSKDTAQRINLFGDFTYTQETFIDLVQKKVSIVEVPLRIRGQREFGESRVAKNVFRYGTRSLIIMLRAIRDFKPFKFFGSIGLILFLLGAACEIFIGVHWLMTSRTSPYQSLVIVGGVLLIMGFLLIMLALIADMLGRTRRIEEEILYYEKRRIYFKEKERDGN